ncbi:MarR family winged helix-turn-helix transcriptional regulator [Pedobacter sandarakinus]|uniref:MarR family winged helix-turn-helix transcriptional regulator n=1 Tax=Pedobacter sandarakinus TaxID=353156 RepID=UPI0022471B6D|nr:MarR family transcriptional regulator [Pedobacter sandarakinus]MCX2574094.1 MarR family transcriptional regulator [Pedobacter sandarakinus]
MLYDLINNLVSLVKEYEQENDQPSERIEDFQAWLNHQLVKPGVNKKLEPEWEGKVNGRSADSVINTSLVHLYRYAKAHAKHAIIGTEFSTPDEFIYLISLSSAGSMSKTALIRLNVHEKPVGTLIINRLLKKGFVSQSATLDDKRSKLITITPDGLKHLSNCLQNIKEASANVTEPLSDHEKMEFIILLQKLEDFHWVRNGVK